ncbi:MAG: phosphotransferase [Anaerolineae bacterium]|jgi:5-methylthioribose kinase
MAQAEIAPEELLEHLHRRLPEFTATAAPKRIRLGYLNYVFRVQGEPEPLIVKVTLPYAAAMPQVPLDQLRLDIEARSLAAFEPGGALERVGSAAVRPPRPLDFDELRHILVMEDVGQAPNLGAWLAEGGAVGEILDGQRPGQLLGRFIAALHRKSFADPQLLVDFDNSAIQRSRLNLHYGAVGDMCRKAGLPDADQLGRKAVTLGEQLQCPGVCIIQGDLWPPSILITLDGLRIVDWELAHYGHPAQDVGHLSSHLGMHAHRASTSEAADRARDTLRDFLSTYRSGLGDAFGEVFGARGARQSTVHFGAEILMRTVGAFQDGYLYEGLAVDAPALQQAVQVAARHIRSPERVDTFAPLLS